MLGPVDQNFGWKYSLAPQRKARRTPEILPSCITDCCDRGINLDGRSFLPKLRRQLVLTTSRIRGAIDASFPRISPLLYPVRRCTSHVNVMSGTCSRLEVVFSPLRFCFPPLGKARWLNEPFLHQIRWWNRRLPRLSSMIIPLQDLIYPDYLMSQRSTSRFVQN